MTAVEALAAHSRDLSLTCQRAMDKRNVELASDLAKQLTEVRAELVKLARDEVAKPKRCAACGEGQC